MADNVYEGLSQFFKLFPDYKGMDFFVAGESYGGNKNTNLFTRFCMLTNSFIVFEFCLHKFSLSS